MTHGPAAGNRAAGGHAASPGSTGDVQTPVTGGIEVQDSDEERGSVLVSVQRVSGPELPETGGLGWLPSEESCFVPNPS